jgi:hypothetical protein
MKKKLLVLVAVLGSPMLAFAAACTTLTTGSGGASSGTIANLLCTVSNILNAIVPVLVALGVVYFVWGVISYVIASDEEAKSSGRNRMIWGIIGLAVIIGLWGLVGILGNTFGINGGTTAPALPAVPLSQ